MTEYIERGEAVELLLQPITMSMCLSVEECHHKRAQRQIDRYLIEGIPAADVRPVVKAVWKHVKWVVDEEWQEGGYWISRCSNCYIPYNEETPFCPHCGADTREDTSDG